MLQRLALLLQISNSIHNRYVLATFDECMGCWEFENNDTPGHCDNHENFNPYCNLLLRYQNDTNLRH